jgi:TonB-linked SusC/RagA family outer membrane protein
MKKNQNYYGLFKPNSNYHKLHLTMKISAFLLFCCFVNVFAAPTYSQSTKISLNLKDVTIEEVLNKIEDVSEFYFLYNNKLIDVNRKVNIEADKEPIKDILNEILTDDTKFILYDKQIILTPNDVTSLSKALQQLKITGVVTDDKGNSLAGVTVMVKGTVLGTLTDATGKYIIDNAPQNATLIFSFIGMATQEIPSNGRMQIDVVLEEDVTELDEIVVVGYGTQKKVTLTGSVVSTKGDAIVKSQTPNVVNSLTGILPGVVINSRNGEPGREDPTIYIRGRSTTGNADPLIIIDGVERGNLGLINPNDIENISVLKDASAAIYGSRAANGVILVTTKRGLNEKPTFNFAYNQGFSQPTRNVKMADSYTFAKVYNEIEIGAGRPPKYTDEELQKFRSGKDPNYANTDWYSYMTKPLTPQHRINLSVTGGTEKMKYYVSIGEEAQDGQFTHSSLRLKQYKVRSNIDATITDWFKIGLNLAGRYGKDHYPYRSTDELYSHIFLYQPNWTPYWPGTKYLTPNRGSENVLNWVSDNEGTNDLDSKSLESTLFYRLDIPWVKGLYVDGTANYDVGIDLTKIFQLPTYVYYYNSTTNTYTLGRTGETSTDLANLTETYVQNTALTLNTKINYERSFGVHNIGVMFGYEQRQAQYNTFMASRHNYVSTALPQIFAGSSDKDYQANDGTGSKAARLNYFGRATYDFAGKYLAQFIFRYDGSQNFPKNKRFGFFPGVSVGWRLSEEEFMKNLGFINNLKIRASYGEMGNDQVNSFQYLTSYGFGNNYVVGNNDVTGLVQTGVPNPKITWEVAKTYNLGLDATLWKGLFGVEFDVFKTRRSNILTTRTAVVPDYTGLLLPDENVGIVENKGFELVLSHSKTINKLRYSVSGNISYARNKVIFADEAPAAEPYQYATGRPMGAKLLYKAIGIFENQTEIDAYPHYVGTQPGDIKYEDVNKDGVINSLDQIRDNLTATPEIVYGINAFLDYKGFDLTVLLQGQSNADVLFSDYFTAMSYSLGNFSAWRAENRWAPDNSTNATMPRASVETWNNNTNTSTQWLVDAGFLRLKNVELGYNLPSSVCEKIKIQKLRIYVSGYNLAILHDHMSKQGFDPETTAYWYYPQQRTYNIGANLTF